MSTALAVSRIGCFGLLVLILLGARHHDGYGSVAALTGVAVIEGVVVIVVSRLRGGLPAGWALLDCALGVVLLTSGQRIGVVLLAAGQRSGFYDYVLLASVALGLPRWSLRAVLAVTCVLAAATVWAQAAAPAPYPLWNIVPNALAIVGVGGLTWALAAQLRSTAGRVDQARAAAVARTGALARERERARQARALRERVLVTLRVLVDREVVTVPAMRAQLVAETAWLQRFVDGTTTRPAGLHAALLEVAQARQGSGLTVRLESAADLVPLPAEVVEALAGAVWEALTNVAKHAGVAAATVRVEATAARVEVVVIDAGRGFEPDRVRRGVGLAGSIRQRLAEVGGSAQVRSEPGAGTTVRLTVPAGSAPEPR